MHRSRFAGIIIDCDADDLEAAARFWSEALGYPMRPLPSDVSGPYVELDTSDDEPYVEVQQVDHQSRVHLDIETDDLDAEADRLERLGARRIGKVKRWIVMQAPTGQRFCIVPEQGRPDFDARANAWDDD